MCTSRGVNAAGGTGEEPHAERRGERGGAGAGAHIAASRDSLAERQAEIARIDTGTHARPVRRGTTLTDVSAGRTTLA